jgi:hypothetical protein
MRAEDKERLRHMLDAAKEAMSFVQGWIGPNWMATANWR